MTKKKVLITGGSGFLGSFLLSSYADRYDVVATYNTHPLNGSHYQIDLTDKENVKRMIDIVQPDIIIHTAALTNVDACERNPQQAFKINTESCGHIADGIQDSSTKLIFISSDQLFDGKKELYTEEDATSPINIYGLSKVKAEEMIQSKCRNHIILRTNFYGLSNVYKHSFLDWCIEALKSEDNVTLYNNIFYTPISLIDVVRIIEMMLASQITGLFNVTGPERISKADFFMKVAKKIGINKTHATFSPYVFKKGTALRPLNMALSNSKLLKNFHFNPKDIQTSLADILQGYDKQ